MVSGRSTADSPKEQHLLYIPLVCGILSAHKVHYMLGSIRMDVRHFSKRCVYRITGSMFDKACLRRNL